MEDDDVLIMCAADIACVGAYLVVMFVCYVVTVSLENHKLKSNFKYGSEMLCMPFKFYRTIEIFLTHEIRNRNEFISKISPKFRPRADEPFVSLKA